MCGIIGFKDTQENRNELVEWIRMLAHRGTDSFGFIAEDDKNIKTLKTLDIKKLGVTVQKLPTMNFVLAHHRKASIGKISTQLAHPIIKGKTHVIHNGTKKALHDVVKKSDSDTEAIAVLLNNISSWRSNLRVVKGLLAGAGVVFAVHTTQGLLFANDGTRTLFVNKSRTVVTSEPIFADTWCLVEPTVAVFKNLNDFIENVKVYTKTYVVDEINLYNAWSTYCYGCGKTHLTFGEDYLCPSCKILSKKETSYSSFNNWNYNYFKPNKKVVSGLHKWAKVGMKVKAKTYDGKEVIGTLTQIDEYDVHRPYKIDSSTDGNTTTNWVKDIEKVKQDKKTEYYYFSRDGKSWQIGRLMSTAVNSGYWVEITNGVKKTVVWFKEKKDI